MISEISQNFQGICKTKSGSVKTSSTLSTCLVFTTPCRNALWPSSFEPGIKTKFKEFSGEI